MERITDTNKDAAKRWQLQAEQNQRQKQEAEASEAYEQNRRAWDAISGFLGSWDTTPEDKLELFEQVKQAEAKAKEQPETWPYLDVVKNSAKLRAYQQAREGLTTDYREAVPRWQREAENNRQAKDHQTDEDDRKAQRVIRQYLEAAANAPEDKLALLEQVKQAEAKATRWPYLDVVKSSDNELQLEELS